MKSRMLLILPADPSDQNIWKKPIWSYCRIAPVGPITIISYLHAKGHEAMLLDCRELMQYYQSNDITPALVSIIGQFRPDFVGINMLTAYFDKVKNIAIAIKENYPKLPLIAGGPHPSVEPQSTLEQIPYLDSVCVGAGEEVCLEIAEGNNLKEIPGLMLRNATEHYRKRAAVSDIDQYPFPNYDLLNHEFYTDWSAYTTFGWLTKSISLLTARSCPYSCKFCASDWSKPLRMHSPEYVIEMVKYLSKFDINTITFWDDTLTASRSRLEKICEGLIDSELFLPRGKLRWRCASRANQATERCRHG